jgi:N-acetylmuramoyl-L-alanine amidase
VQSSEKASSRARRRRRRRWRAVVLAGASLAAVVLGVRAVSGGARPAPQTAPGNADSGKLADAVQTADGGVEIDPSYFADGACASFAPTQGNRHLTVFLDAGHGGIDPGGTGTTESGEALSESTLTLPVELDTMAILRAQGFTVVVSRTENTTVLRLKPDDESDGELSLLGAHDDEAARDVCANMAKATVLVGIYFDSSSSPLNAGSVTGYDPDRPFSSDNLRLANLVQKDVLGAMNAQGWGIPDGGVQSDAGLGSLAGNDSTGSSLAEKAAAYDHLLLLGPAEEGYFSTPSQMPGALIEPLYLSDPFEGSIADSSSGQQVIAGGLARAIESYFAPPPVAHTAAPATNASGSAPS